MPTRRRWLGILTALACLVLIAALASRMPDEEPTNARTAGGREQPSGPGAPPAADAGNGFDVDAIQVGDTVAGLKVARMEVTGGGEGDETAPLGATVGFSGQVTITGTYVHHPADEEFVGGEVCMEEIDPDSQARLPRMRGDERYLWFCFANTEEAGRALAPTGVGKATVVIDDYTIDYRPTETWNTASLVRVEEIRDARPWTKPVTISVEGMKESRTYRLVYLRILPFSTYMPEDWQYEPQQAESTQGIRLLAPHDIGFIDVVFFAPGTSREQVDAAVAERLAAYPESEPVEPQPWAVAAFRASDRTPKDASRWRTARLYVGQRGDRFFYVLSHLDRLEAGDGWGPTVEAILDEWRWWDTGEPLRPAPGGEGG